jgi:hypothetical protein
MQRYKQFALFFILCCASNATILEAGWFDWCVKKPFSAFCSLIGYVMPVSKRYVQQVRQKNRIYIDGEVGKISEEMSSFAKIINKTLDESRQNLTKAGQQIEQMRRQITDGEQSIINRITEAGKKVDDVNRKSERLFLEQERQITTLNHNLQEQSVKLEKQAQQLQQCTENVVAAMKKSNELENKALIISVGIRRSSTLKVSGQVPSIDDIESDALKECNQIRKKIENELLPRMFTIEQRIGALEKNKSVNHMNNRLWKQDTLGRITSAQVGTSCIVKNS